LTVIIAEFDRVLQRSFSFDRHQLESVVDTLDPERTCQLGLWSGITAWAAELQRNFSIKLSWLPPGPAAGGIEHPGELRMAISAPGPAVSVKI
jgi:hypothetical protein